MYSYVAMTDEKMERTEIKLSCSGNGFTYMRGSSSARGAETRRMSEVLVVPLISASSAGNERVHTPKYPILISDRENKKSKATLSARGGAALVYTLVTREFNASAEICR